MSSSDFLAAFGEELERRAAQIRADAQQAQATANDAPTRAAGRAFLGSLFGEAPAAPERPADLAPAPAPATAPEPPTEPGEAAYDWTDVDARIVADEQ